MRARAVAIALAALACSHPAPLIGREFPQNPPTYVELIDADEQTVWKRVHEVLARYHVPIKEERYSDGEGYIVCKPFSISLPGAVNDKDYRPGEIVAARGKETLYESYRLEIYITTTRSGVVRLWTDAAIALQGFMPGEVRLTNLVGAGLIAEAVQPMAVVKEWRWNRAGLAESLPEYH